MAKYKSEDIVRFAAMLGGNLKFLRMDRKVFMPQKVPAAHLGITHQQMNKYESGKNIPCTYRLVQLADFFKVTPNDLVNPDLINQKAQEVQNVHN